MTHPGEVASYLAGVRHALEPSYDVERKEFAGQVVLVGHRSDFRLRWFASRLHTTVTVAAFDAGVDAAQLDEYLAAAGRAARDAGGRVPRGLQSGTAAVAVAVLPTLSADARDWALHPHGHRFASVGYPVAVGISPAEIAEPERMRVGMVFHGFLRDVVRDVVAAPLAD